MDAVNLKVLDISHHNVGPGGDDIDFSAIAAFGVRGIIHKATQGVRMNDQEYEGRRQQACDSGLLWGAYDFNTGDPAKDQVDYFLQIARPAAKTVCALDFEDNRASQMSIELAREYLEYGAQQLGRSFWIYTGNRFKDLIVQYDDEMKSFFAQHRLWLCEYGPRMKLIDANGEPLPWQAATLWQFSGDGVANRGLTVPGILHGDRVDMNSFGGSDDELAASWA